MNLASILISTALAGVLGTVAMDLGSAAAEPIGISRKTNPRLIGRWVFHLLQGRFSHPETIVACPEVIGEVPLGWIAHYGIGSLLGLIYGYLLIICPLDPKDWIDPILYGVLTTVFAWFFLFPSMGFGWLGSNAPKEAALIRTSLVNHLFYGLGMAFALRFLL